MIRGTGSGHPGAAAHQGPAGEFVDLPPRLDPQRPQHQELHPPARLAGIPVRLGHVSPGQVGGNLIDAVDLLQFGVDQDDVACRPETQPGVPFTGNRNDTEGLAFLDKSATRCAVELRQANR
jgi:hypothetical protein